MSLEVDHSPSGFGMTTAQADTWIVRDPEPEDAVKPCLDSRQKL